MAINRQSSLDIDEVCLEFGINKSDLLALVENGGLAGIEKKDKKTSSTFVFQSFLTALEASQISNIRSDRTTQNYTSLIKRFLSYLEDKSIFFEELNEKIILEFLLKKGEELNTLSIGTINTYFAIVRKVASYAYENDIVSKNINYRFKKCSYYTLPKYFSHQQLGNIFLLVFQRNYCYLWKAIFTTLLYTGLRVSEVANLTVKDFDMEDGFIKTIGKGQKPQQIPIYPEVKEAVQEYFNIYNVTWSKNNEEFLFCKDFGSNRKRNVKSYSIQYTLKEITKKLKFPSNLTVHSFRHTFAVNCLKQGMKIEYLGQLLGHSDPTTTAIYTKLLPHDLQLEVQDKFPIPLEKIIQEVLGS